MLTRRAFLVGSAFALGGCDPMLRRLLLGGGGSSFTAPASEPPPFDDSWVRSGSNPIISATESWEGSAVQEPCVTYEAGWKMWYRGGGWPGSHTAAIGYATSSDGIAWTKDAGNPVLGQGGSGISGNAWLPWIVKVGSTYYMSYIAGAFGATFAQATSTDGIAWTPSSPTISKPGGIDLWGNRVVWKEGATWYMIAEGAPNGSFWRMYLYTSTDGLAWTIQNGGTAYGSLGVAASGAYGGPRFANMNGVLTPTFDGTYHLWYHAAPGAGNLPTNIYHSTTTDLFSDSWTTPNIVLTHAGSGFEVDQVAGPCPIVVGATAYLFYDGDDNTGEIAKIGVATA